METTVVSSRLWNQQESDLLDSLIKESNLSHRAGLDGWGNTLPEKPHNVLILDSELYLITKKLSQVETSPDDLSLKLKEVDYLYERLCDLSKFPRISLMDRLLKATRDGELGFKPIDYQAWKKRVGQNILDVKKSLVMEALVLLEGAIKKLQQSERTEEMDRKLEKALQKQSEYREFLNEYEHQRSSAE